MAVIKSNELLCFMTHQYVKDSADNIKKAVLSTFVGEEILLAKNTLYNDHKDILGKSFPRKDSSKRSQAVADLDDIFEALAKLDSNKKLPKYSAIDICKLPGYSVPSVQANGELIDMVHLMANKLKSMETMLQNVYTLVQSHLPQCTDILEEVSRYKKPTYADTVGNTKLQSSPERQSLISSPTRGEGVHVHPNGSSGDPLPNATSTTSEEAISPRAIADVIPDSRPKVPAKRDLSSVASTYKKDDVNKGGFQLQRQEAKKLRRREILFGRHRTCSKLRGGPMPRRDYYISRLHADTTIPDMHEHLSDKGIKPLEVLDLTKEGHSLRSFKVSINLSDNDSFLDDNMWPFGVMVKRYFPPKSVIVVSDAVSN